MEFKEAQWNPKEKEEREELLANDIDSVLYSPPSVTSLMLWLCVCYFSYNMVESVSSPFKSGLALDLLRPI